MFKLVVRNDRSFFKPSIELKSTRKRNPLRRHPIDKMARSVRSQRSQEVCRNYLNGRCQFGSKCRFVHPSKSCDERDRDSRRHHNSSSSGARKHKRHNEVSPDSEKKHRHHKKSRHGSPSISDLEALKILKNKKRLRSPEEGMVSDEGSELEEGQTVDGDDLERKRRQLQKELELLQGTPAEKRRSSSSSSSSGRRSSSSSISPSIARSDSDRGIEDTEPGVKLRTKWRIKRRTSPGSVLHEPNEPPPLKDSSHRSNRRQLSPGGPRGGRSVSPPFSHSAAYGSSGGYGTTRHGDDFRANKNRQHNSYRSPSPRAHPGGRHASSSQGGHFGRGNRGNHNSVTHSNNNNNSSSTSSQHFRAASPDLPPKLKHISREERFKKKSVDDATPQKVVTKRKSATATSEGGEEDSSSNDESISSVLVEEAHMGEDDQDDPTANNTTLTPSLTTTTTTTSPKVLTAEENGHSKSSDISKPAELSNEESVKAEENSSEDKLINDDDLPEVVSPSAQPNQHNNNNDNNNNNNNNDSSNINNNSSGDDEDDEKPFSDWSSEEDDLLGKEDDNKNALTSDNDGSLGVEGKIQNGTNTNDDDRTDNERSETNGPHSEAEYAISNNILEETEAISDDDLEALIEEDNEPPCSDDHGAEQKKRFQPAPIYNALEIDWESLVKDQKKKDLSLEVNGEPRASNEFKYWSAQSVFLRIGLSYDLSGRQLAEEVERILPEKLQSTVAGLHVALSREATDMKQAFDQAGGPYARALSARRDLQLRKKLAAVKETIPDERGALFNEAVKMYHQIVNAKL